jgi:methylphosphotriester-DNA--protein-cysteine methyltransferase
MSSTTVIQRKSPSLEDRRHQFDDLCTWIVDHLNQPLGWQELMSQSGLDHHTLNAMFFRFSTTTPMAWIRQQRTQRLSAPIPLRAAPNRLHRTLAVQA